MNFDFEKEFDIFYNNIKLLDESNVKDLKLAFLGGILVAMKYSNDIQKNKSKEQSDE